MQKTIALLLALQPGIWQAAHYNNTVKVQGTIVIERRGASWVAQAGSETSRAPVDGPRLAFYFGACRCSFRGTIRPDAGSAFGHWYQAPTADSGNSFASPVVLRRTASGVYEGTIHPLYDPFAFFMAIAPAQGATAKTFMVNPQRDLGDQWRVAAIRQENNVLTLLGGASGTEAVASGVVQTDGTASLYFDGRGGTYDFTRVPPNAPTSFYPAGRPHVTYAYVPPPQLNDGWTTGSVDAVRLSKGRIERFVQMLIDTPMDGPKARQIHAFLVARHGKLVVEEYFHGARRDVPHDPRSASKSITATLFGAAMLAGFPLSVKTPVYAVMNGGTFPAGLDARKRRMTVESLLTMSSGWDCDDTDDASPGSEDHMSDDLNVSDWYGYTLNLKMLREPGTQAVYCSIQPNMVGGVLARAAKRSVPELLHQLIAVPMQIDRYYVPLKDNGDAYMGGGLRLVARDFMKFPQLYLNGGIWNGRRIVTKQWTQQATLPHVKLKYYHDPMYGYLWWIKDFAYRGRSYRAFSMLGAGGQAFTAIPALDMVVGFEAGDYSHHLPGVFSTYIPEYILPAVEDLPR